MQGAENQESRFLLRGDATSIQTSHCRINLRRIYFLCFITNKYITKLSHLKATFFSVPEKKRS